jgi:hypothetical protein
VYIGLHDNYLNKCSINAFIRDNKIFTIYYHSFNNWCILIQNQYVQKQKGENYSSGWYVVHFLHTYMTCLVGGANNSCKLKLQSVVQWQIPLSYFFGSRIIFLNLEGNFIIEKRKWEPLAVCVSTYGTGEELNRRRLHIHDCSWYLIRLHAPPRVTWVTSDFFSFSFYLFAFIWETYWNFFHCAYSEASYLWCF